jgi:glycerophosphoryl diester phosphodiesterase
VNSAQPINPASGPAALAPLVLGHRGGDVGAPNSIDAIENAIADGADGVEIDIQLDADGELVAQHDLGPAQSGRTPPTLAELLPLIERTGATLLIDFKSSNDPSREAAALGESLADFTKTELVMVSSFSVPFLEHFSDITDRFALYPIVSLRQNFPSPHDMSRWSGVSVLAAALVVNPFLTRRIQRQRKDLIVWFGATEWAPAIRASAKLRTRAIVVASVKSAANLIGPKGS